MRQTNWPKVLRHTYVSGQINRTETKGIEKLRKTQQSLRRNEDEFTFVTLANEKSAPLRSVSDRSAPG